MRTIEKFRFKSILLFFLLGIFVAVSVTPVQAQVTKRDHKTKEKTKTRDQRKKKTKTRDLGNKKVPNNDKAIDDSDSFINFLVTNPPSSTQEDLRKWNRIVHKMQGIEGFDPVRNYIGSAPVEKNWPLPVGYKNNWIPLDKQKQVCCGKLENFKTFDGRDDETDWNFHILPNDEFSFLITEALPYKKKPFPIKNPKGWHKKGSRGEYTLEAEVTPDESLFQNVFFPIKRKKGRESNDPKIGLEGKEICVYGPWIREWFHHNRPEIHPSEMIWWRESKGYYMMLIQDGSKRFDDKDKFDFGFLGGSAPDNWKPWTKSPLTAQFKIAFEVNPSTSELPLKMDIREVYKRFIVTKDDADASKDSDNDSSHTLVIDNRKLLVVNEQQENDNDLGVEFVDITKRADGTIQGYLQITTKVGGSNKKDIGYHVIYVASSSIPIKRTVRDHRTD
ncbi:MAG: hypothetical protein ACI9P5_001177 [Saprospiraceae bacterium]|jgi:hypothetical protein